MELFFHNCPCQGEASYVGSSFDDHTELVKKLETIRSGCSALKGILIPNTVWGDVRTGILNSDDNVLNHIILRMYQQGTLPRVTNPIHRYLTDFNRTRTRLNKNHLKAFKESWGGDDFPQTERQRIRVFWRRFSELHVAEWIETMGWTISNLEMWGARLDIECTSPANIECVIEVKSIVAEDLEHVLELGGDMANGVPIQNSPYHPSNLVLLRSLEAAGKVRDCEKVRIACLVLSEDIWSRFEPVLRESWNLWNAPRFLELSPKLQSAIQRDNQVNPEDQEELKAILHCLNALWVLKRSPSFELSSYATVPFNTPSPAPQ